MSTSTKEAAGLTWEEICQDPRFDDLPYKIETNARGQIVMSPTHQYHGALQAEIAGLLRDAMEGRTVTESAIATSDGTKVADVAWYSTQRWDDVKDSIDAPIAPEVAVEILSPGNSIDQLAKKRRLYFEAGAEEVWVCDDDGKITFFEAAGKRERSRRVPSFPERIDV